MDAGSWDTRNSSNTFSYLLFLASEREYHPKCVAHSIAPESGTEYWKPAVSMKQNPRSSAECFKEEQRPDKKAWRFPSLVAGHYLSYLPCFSDGKTLNNLGCFPAINALSEWRMIVCPYERDNILWWVGDGQTNYHIAVIHTTLANLPFLLFKSIIIVFSLIA